MLVFLSLGLFFLSFIGLSYSAEIIVKSVGSLASRLHISTFVLSFFVLGFLTSLPELSVGLNAVYTGQPDIYAGNMTGASIVLFLFVIPILAIFGNGITLTRQLPPKKLILSILTIITPFLLLLDGHLSLFDAFVAIAAYFILISSVKNKRRLFRRVVRTKTKNLSFNPGMELFRVILGAGLIYLSSRVLVDRTIFFTQFLNLPIYLVSFIVLAVGTNLPELFIALKSVLNHQKDIAFGNYIGSAAVNTLFIGVLTFLNGPFSVSGRTLWLNFLIFAFGLFVFYRFSRSKNNISRPEGFFLLGLYLLLVVSKILQFFIN